MNSQELFLDVASGRFMDGESTIPTTKPTIFSDEQRNLKINIIQIIKNVINKKQPADNASFKVRLGTTSLKLADGEQASTQPINTIMATATIITSPASRAVGSAKIFTYTPVTANIISSIATFPIVTGVFRLNVDYVAPVTASITAGFAIPTPSIITRPLQYTDSGIGASYELSDNSVRVNPDLAQALNTTTTATFTSTILSGEVVRIDIGNKGRGYPSGTYSLNIAKSITTGASFTATISNGVVTTISIVTGGFGYSNGPFNLVFGATTGTIAAATASAVSGSINQITITNGGTDYLTAPSVTLAAPTAGTAVATVVASGGFIQSLTITSGGFGYTNAPSVTLFQPARTLIAVGDQIVDLGCKGINTNTIPLEFSEPDASLTPPISKKPIATIQYTGNGSLWKIVVSDVGYGYSATPTVSHGDILAYLPILKTGFTTNYINVNDIVSGVSDITRRGNARFDGVALSTVLTFSETATKINFGGLKIGFNPDGFFPDNHKWITGGYSFDNAFRYIYATRNGNTYSIDPRISLVQRSAVIERGADLYNSIGVVVTGSEYDPKYQIATIANSLNGKEAPGLSAKINGVTIVGRRNPATLNANANAISNFPNPQHDKFAGKSALVAVVPKDRSIVPTRYAVMEIFIPRRDTSYQVAALDLGANGLSFSYQDFGGGRYTPEFRVLDAGAGYPTTYTKSYDLVELGSLTSDPVIFEFSGTTVYTMPATIADGFINTSFSNPASIATRPGPASVQYFLGSGGVGYTKSTNIGFQTVQTLGLVRSASITNVPASYSDGTYSCVVQAPASGTAAQIDLVVTNNGTSSKVVIVNGGNGYTSSPIVTAPAPNFISGQVKSVSVLTQPQGYSIGQQFYLSVPTSPVAGGQASVLFKQSESGSVNVIIENPGFGYQASQVATAPDPDRRLQSGFLRTLELQNSPNGYKVGQTYSLQIQESPQTGGNAVANIIKESESKYSFQIINAGTGYTSAPLITAPSPDAPNGLLSSVAITTIGAGYAPGIYEATVGTAPSGGQTGKVNYIVDSNLNGQFIIQDAGLGYISAPSISVATPAGSVISSISITCGGSYYTRDNYTATIQDATGLGAKLDNPNIQNGVISSINVLGQGYGFTNNPIIMFSKPPVPQTSALQRNQLDLTFNITTASANAILATSTLKDILMEVFETDGTNDQVLGQATISLAKRVLK